ncbi:hypothetical protein HDU96_006470 [Phlyctochytrium bullatum]|nr:hypothetical protein HDU96_006470 [Phlyctochytrium bullatum]
MMTVWLFLKFPAAEGKWREKLGRVDWLGSLLLMAGVSCLITPVQLGGSTWDWSAPQTIALLILSALLLIAFELVEVYVAKEPIIPPSLFTNRPAAAFISMAFCHIFYLLMAGVGCGCAIQIRLSGLLVSVDPDLVSVATAASQFFQTLGGTIGVAITGTVYNNVFATRLTESPTLLKGLDGQDPTKVNLPILREILVSKGETGLLGELVRAFVWAFQVAYRAILPFPVMILLLAYLVKRHQRTLPLPDPRPSTTTSKPNHVPATAIDINDEIPKSSTSIDATVRVPLSRSQFWFVFLGLTLSILLAALDQTIVATTLEKIVKEFGQQELIPWIGSGYLLTETSAAAISARSSAPSHPPCSSSFSVLGRIIAGIGGGGIVSAVLIIIADMVSISEAGKYQGMIAAVYGFSSVVGPLAGGTFSDHLTWRWCFWINLPFGAVAVLTVWMFLKFPAVEGKWKDKLGRVDWLGALLLTAGVSCLITPVQLGGSTWNWSAPETIALLVLSVLVLTVFAYVEVCVAKEPIIPASLFKSRTVTPFIIIAFSMGSTYFPSFYYISLFFQVALGKTATAAGLLTIPFILGVVVLSIVSGHIHSKTGHYLPFLVIGPVLMIAGISLISTLADTSSLVQQIFYLMVAGVGCGCVIQIRLSGLLVSIDPDLMAVATAVSQFFQTLGGTIGVAITGTIFNNVLAMKMAESPTLLEGLDGQDPAKVNLPILREILVARGETELLGELVRAFVWAFQVAYRAILPFPVMILLLAYLVKRYAVRAKA